MLWVTIHINCECFSCVCNVINNVWNLLEAQPEVSFRGRGWGSLDPKDLWFQFFSRVSPVYCKQLMTNLWSPSNLFCVNCTKFVQLIHRKIIKIVATRCHIYFKAEMHQIRFHLRLRHRPRWRSLQRSPRSPSWI